MILETITPEVPKKEMLLELEGWLLELVGRKGSLETFGNWCCLKVCLDVDCFWCGMSELLDLGQSGMELLIIAQLEVVGYRYFTFQLG